MRKTYTKTTAGLKHGYRSGLEDRVAEQIKSKGMDVKYEQFKIRYTKPVTSHVYSPDFELTINGKQVIIETKGRFTVEDRKKHLYVKEQYPDLDIRFVFTNSNAKITKTSKTSYGDWCEKNGFVYADKLIPDEWFNGE
jgi:predicted nuclease of restriction endonuclease-like RecB superfamily